MFNFTTTCSESISGYVEAEESQLKLLSDVDSALDEIIKTLAKTIEEMKSSGLGEQQAEGGVVRMKVADDNSEALQLQRNAVSVISSFLFYLRLSSIGNHALFYVPLCCLFLKILTYFVFT